MNDIHLRKGVDSDIDTYLEVEKTMVGNKLYSTILDRKEVADEIKKNEVYFIEISGQPIGYISYEIKNPQEAYISGLVVIPDFQGKGIARKVLGLVSEKLVSFKKIWLVTHPDNVKAISLYESLGFKIGERKDDYFGDGQPRIVLTLEK